MRIILLHPSNQHKIHDLRSWKELYKLAAESDCKRPEALKMIGHILIVAMVGESMITISKYRCLRRDSSLCQPFRVERRLTDNALHDP